MNTRSSKLLGLSIALVIAGAVFTPDRSEAKQGLNFNVGSKNVCIGLSSCLFHTKKRVGGRDSNNTKDHRNRTTDHRKRTTTDHRRSRVVVVVEEEGNIRDHRRKVRDHRRGPRVRDHRRGNRVRDHR